MNTADRRGEVKVRLVARLDQGAAVADAVGDGEAIDHRSVESFASVALLASAAVTAPYWLSSSFCSRSISRRATVRRRRARRPPKNQAGVDLFKTVVCAGVAGRVEQFVRVAKRNIAEVDAWMIMAKAEIAAAERQVQQARGNYEQALELNSSSTRISPTCGPMTS
jgi:hypothetical protein